MPTPIIDLARDSRFIPLVYNYCDMWCERCPITDRCLLFASDQRGEAMAGDSDPTRRIENGVQFARAVVEASGPGDNAVAALDVALAHPSTSPREPALGHPLEYLARHYAVQAAGYLSSLRGEEDGRFPAGSPLEVVAWYHVLIAAKTYRALVSEHRSGIDAPELLGDALGCAKLVLIAIGRSIAAWRTINATDDDARVGGVIELLEALETGVELRFPDARAFLRPGLDDPVNACATGSGGSGGGSDGEAP